MVSVLALVKGDVYGNLLQTKLKCSHCNVLYRGKEDELYTCLMVEVGV